MKKEKSQCETVLDHLRAGIVVHELTSRIRYANAKAGALLGWTPDQLVGVESHDPRFVFCREDGSSMPMEEYPANRALASKEIVEDVVVGLKRLSDGELVWMICNAEPVLDDEGNVLEAVVSFTDITWLKSIERALHESEERLRLMIDGSNASDPRKMCACSTRALAHPRRLYEIGLSGGRQAKRALFSRRFGGLPGCMHQSKNRWGARSSW